MSKPKTEPVAASAANNKGRDNVQKSGPEEPMSGSKKIKNRNHSRHNNGEG